jgi:hypothetical protein
MSATKIPAVIARLDWAIQYSRDADINREGAGVLDTRMRYDDGV